MKPTLVNRWFKICLLMVTLLIALTTLVYYIHQHAERQYESSMQTIRINAHTSLMQTKMSTLQHSADKWFIYQIVCSVMLALAMLVLLGLVVQRRKSRLGFTDSHETN